MSKTLTTLALALLLASPAVAGHPKQEQREASELDRLQRVAARLEARTAALFEHAARDLRRRGPRQEQVLCDLDYLEGRAARFRQRLDKYAYRPHKLRREIKRLNAAYHRAEHSLQELRHARHLKQDFAQVGRLVERLHDRYEDVLVVRTERSWKRRAERHAAVPRPDYDAVYGPYGPVWELARRWGYSAR